MEKIDGKMIKESRWKLGISQSELSAATWDRSIGDISARSEGDSKLLGGICVF